MNKMLNILKYIFSFFGKTSLVALCALYTVLGYSQNFPVQVIPQAIPPAPIHFSDYADASTVSSPLRVQIILNDLEIANREVRLKAYFQGNNITFQSNDIVVGADPLFLEGGVPLILTNVELAPYFQFQNITGISPNVYGQTIPEGAYQFCFEVYDVLSGNRLSNKSCATTVVFQNEPPFLVMPRDKTNIEEINPQNIVFQWTPRSINVTNVEYELSLVEIWDTQIDPQAAFLSSPPVFQTTTTATTYVYGPVDPLLLSGKNYAWRVQARAKQGIEEIGLFKNEGYSEIFSFSYAGSCDLPLSLNHEVKGSTNANIFWDDFTTDIPEYTVRYRKKGNDNEWFLSKTTTNQLTLWDLKAGTTYEYQIQKKCTVTGSDWSLAKEFTTFIADDEASVYDCGINPDFTLTNKEPLANLSSGEKFTAGDFPINVLEVSGSNGRFTGTGYVTIPYLNSIRVGVKFTNVLINTDKKLAEGTVITTYDPSLKNILDIDEAIETVENAADAVGEFFEGDNDLDEMRVNFSIPKDKVNDYITVEDGIVTITNPENGASISEPLGDDKVVVDKDGQVYHIDAEGNITEGGTIDPGGAVNAGNVDGVANNGELESLTAEGILVTFNTPGTYGFDKMPSNANDKLKKEYEIIKDADGNDYVLPHHAVNKGTDTKITATIIIKNNAYIADSVVFKTKQGEKIPATFSGNTATLTIRGSYTFESETIYAVVPDKEDSTKQLTAGAFTLWHLTERAVKVALVSVNNASLGDIENTVTNIFKQGVAKINFQETLALSFDKDQLGTNGLDVGESAWAAAYNDEQKQLVNAVKKHSKYKNDTYYILVFGDISPSRSIAGFMPLQRQMGFVFSGTGDEEGKGGDKGKVLAHEIGHGIFALQHPFSQYGEDMREKTDWLMDYNGGTNLPHMHWAQIHNPDLKFYIFQDEEDGEYGAFEYLVGQNVVPNLFINNIPDFKGNTISFVSSAGKIITIPSTASDITFNNNGALWAFTVPENGIQERYISTKWTKTGNFAGYLKQAGAKKNWKDIVYKDNASRTAPEGQPLTVYSGILEKSNNLCGIRLFKGKYPNEADRNEWNSGGNETPFVDQIVVQDKTKVGNSLISSPEACDLCVKGEKFYNDHTYLIKNDEGSAALLEISKLICSNGPEAIDYDILVTQIGKDSKDQINSFWNGSDIYNYNLAKELFWQNPNALSLYQKALERVNKNIEKYSGQLNTDATKEDYYASLYYLNDDFLGSLKLYEKQDLLKLIFEHNFFIGSDFLEAGKSDVSLIKKVVNTIPDSEINSFYGDLLDDYNSYFHSSNSSLEDKREILFEITNALELEKLETVSLDVKIAILQRLLNGSLFELFGTNYNDVIAKLLKSVPDSEAILFLKDIEDPKKSFDTNPLVFHLKNKLSDFFSNDKAYTSFFKEIIRLSAAKAQQSSSDFNVVASIDWKVENRDYVLINLVRDKNNYEYNYNETNHRIELNTCKETVYLPNGGSYCANLVNSMPTSDDASLFDFVMINFYKDASPFSPIANKNIYEEESEIEAEAYIVPAIFLEYMQNQTNEARWKNVAWNTFNVVMTVATIGEGTVAINVVRVAASSTGKNLVGRALLRQGFALMDFTYTVGTNGYRLTTGNQLPEYVQNIGYLFAAKGVYDLTESGLKGLKGLRALKQLSDDDKMKAIRDYLKITRKDGKSITIEEVNEFMTTAEQKIFSSENIQWKEAWESTSSFKVADALAPAANYSKSIIKSKRGFVNQIYSLLEQEGLKMDDFHYMMQKSSNALTTTEKEAINRIRAALPKPNSTSVMQKVIPKGDIEKYINGAKGTNVSGYVTKAADAKHLETFEDLYNGLRLDYTGTEFFIGDGSCGVLRFTSSNTKSAVIPAGGSYAKYEYPFTAHGFTAGKSERLGAPEWHLPNNIEMEEGAELWEILNDGSEILRGRIVDINGTKTFEKVSN